MAYENYNFVAWTDGSPLSSNRLGQMSINIEQVKDVVDDKAQGVIKLNQLQAVLPNSGGYSGLTKREIIALKDQSAEVGGSDRRVTIAENRYYKLSVNIPAITILNAGAEDSRYVIEINEGTGVDDPNLTLIASWEVSPPVFSFYNVGTDANTAVISRKTTTYPTKIASGTFSVVQSTTTRITNKSFFVSISRTSSIISNNIPNWRIDATGTSPLQFYVEDVGGI